jgi:hypothetical protein
MVLDVCGIMSMGKPASFQVHADPKLKASASVDIDLLAVTVVFLAADILINKKFLQDFFYLMQQPQLNIVYSSCALKS